MNSILAIPFMFTIILTSISAWSECPGGSGSFGYYQRYQPYCRHYGSGCGHNFYNYPYAWGYHRPKAEPKPVVPETQQPRRPENVPEQTRLQEMGKNLEQQHKNVIVMFTKDACPYCQYMKPIMQRAEQKYGDSVKFIFADINANPQYVSQYGFSTVPHIAYFKNGKKLHAHGSGDKTMTLEQVEHNIKLFYGDNVANN